MFALIVGVGVNNMKKKEFIDLIVKCPKPDAYYCSAELPGTNTYSFKLILLGYENPISIIDLNIDTYNSQGHYTETALNRVKKLMSKYGRWFREAMEIRNGQSY